MFMGDVMYSVVKERQDRECAKIACGVGTVSGFLKHFSDDSWLQVFAQDRWLMAAIDETEPFNELQLTAVMAACRLVILAGDRHQRPWHNQQRVGANLDRRAALDPDRQTSEKRSSLESCSAQKWISRNRLKSKAASSQTFRFGGNFCRFLRNALF